MNNANVKVGFLNPGSMGVSIAASAIAGGCAALWAGEGRSADTHVRAQKHGLVDVGTIAALGEQSDIIFSICPPAAAQDVAEAVAKTGFNGIFVDANAVSPPRMEAIAETVTSGGCAAVDGAIIGHPAWKPGTTYLHLSGPRRAEVAACFAGSVLGTTTMSDRIGEASALKMCFAALTKGTAALIASILATADQLGVSDALKQQWDANEPGRAQRHQATVRSVPEKAWRWVDEMEEIARTFEAAGLPGGFHLASADVFRRLSDLKDGPHPADLATVIRRLKSA